MNGFVNEDYYIQVIANIDEVLKENIERKKMCC